MKIHVELPEATKPERAWIEETTLHVDYHLFRQDLFYYVDAHATIPFEAIVDFTMQFGSRRGFKGMRLTYRDAKDRHITILKMSDNHEEVVIQIYNLLKKSGLTARREIVSGKGVTK